MISIHAVRKWMKREIGLAANATGVFWGEFGHIPYLAVNDYPEIFRGVVPSNLFCRQ